MFLILSMNAWPVGIQSCVVTQSQAVLREGVPCAGNFASTDVTLQSIPASMSDINKPQAANSNVQLEVQGDPHGRGGLRHVTLHELHDG